MAETTNTWCRIADCAAGVTYSAAGGVAPASGHPLGGEPCALCVGSARAAADPRRVRKPRRRVGDRWEDVPWETALAEIGGRLKDVRKRCGVDAVGLYAGAPAALHTATLVRTLAWPLATGSASVYTALGRNGAAWLRAVELVVGRALPLQGDVGRAHYVVLLGANQEAQGWGPLQAGQEHGAELTHSRRTKGTKVVAVDPRRTPLAAGADQHFAIRPGTELFFVLGMIDAILKGGWRDQQYTDDWCAGLDALAAALAAWPVERCAEACGVGPNEISGVALKFSRSAMGLVHRSPQALDGPNGTLTAWAVLVLHALTANLLRPGGLFENPGLFDVAGLAGKVRTDGAPRTRTGGYPLLWLQGPGAILADELLTPGEGQVRALVSVHGDPAADEPGGARLRAALADLDLLVAIDVADTATTRLAHWVLPATHPWEQADLHFADTAVLPRRHAQWSAAAVAAPGEARDADVILADLFRAYGPALRGSRFGAPTRLLGGRLVTGDAAGWAAHKLGGRGYPGEEAVRAAPTGWDGGDVDRAGWPVATASGRLELLPPPIADALARLTPPSATPGLDRWLLTSAARDRAVRRFDRPEGVDPGVTLHPSAGFAEGETVRVRTEAGAVRAVVHLDEGLRPDVVDLPAGYVVDVAALVPTEPLDPLVGTAAWNGLACAVERVG